ncbi:MAG TPA: glycosyltransferase [Pyrinomonadaceae bacterium]|nr:glycosyltransferase [Pyrinomonadaceae bacterium]
MKKIPRVAFFPDSFLEVNGVAMTSKRLIGYAKRHGYPYLCIHAGKKTESASDESIKYLSLKRSPVAFPMDEDLKYDPLFQRHTNRVLRELVEFKPDVIHITGLNDVSIVGAYLAWKLQIPMVGSWHTNLHEFAARRLTRMLRFLPQKTLDSMTGFAERKIMDGAVLYYKMPKVVLSPNQELVDLLGKGTKRVSRLMSRGVDTDKFAPEKRSVRDDVFRFGFVGRLRAEKNVRLLADLEKKLLEKGKTNFKFVIVGEGNEREWLEKNMTHVEFTGFLDGEKLSEAYANMDVFVFPSETDAFGNVAQEANASGVPAIVTNQGGPKFIIKHNESGFIAEDFDDFVKYALELMDNPEKLATMKKQSRANAMSSSWDAVFEAVYDAYREAIEIAETQKRSNGNAA